MHLCQMRIQFVVIIDSATCTGILIMVVNLNLKKT